MSTPSTGRVLPASRFEQPPQACPTLVSAAQALQTSLHLLPSRPPPAALASLARACGRDPFFAFVVLSGNVADALAA